MSLVSKIRLVGSVLALVALGSTLAFAGPDELLVENADTKLKLIKEEQARPGSHIVFPLEEIRAWSESEAPEGVTDPKVILKPGGKVELHGMIDFLAVAGEDDSVAKSLFAPLLRGNRPMDIFAHVDSAPGFVIVTVDEVRLSGVTLSPTLLDFLVKTFLQPKYPKVRFDEPMALEYGMDRLDVEPAGVTVFMKGAE